MKFFDNNLQGEKRDKMFILFRFRSLVIFTVQHIRFAVCLVCFQYIDGNNQLSKAKERVKWRWAAIPFEFKLQMEFSIRNFVKFYTTP